MPLSSTALTTAGIVLAASASVAGMNVLAARSRTYGREVSLATHVSDVQLVDGPAEVLALWRDRRVRGRRVLHVGSYLHFVSPDRPPGAAMEAGAEAALEAELVGGVNHENYLYVAAELGYIRSAHYVTSPARLVARQRALGLPEDPTAILELPDLGFRRVIATAALPLEEPVLLDVHASYFEDADVEDLYRLLRSAPLRADVVTLCLSVGATDVSDLARNRMRAFARSYGREDPRP